MQKIAWKGLTKNGGIGRASINHFTSDGKKTFCNKDIPQKVHCLNAFGPKNCDKCLLHQSLLEDIEAKARNKVNFFKFIVGKYGGNYEFTDGVHRAWWHDADKKDLYAAYGRLAPVVDIGDGLCLTDNWLKYQVEVVA